MTTNSNITSNTTTSDAATNDDSPGSTAERYRGSPAELYERHFVPQIGRACAEPLVEAARLTAGERVVDIACGTGVVARLAAERVGRDGSVAGVDGHPGMLAVARAVTDAPVEWHEASAEGLPFGDATFDVALCSLGLQFFADKVRALAEMRRVVGEHGRIAVGVPGPTPPLMHDLHDVLAARLGIDVAAFVQAVFAVDDPERLAALFAAAGTGDVDVTSQRLDLRLDPPADFLWQYLLGTPLAMAVAGLDADGRRALEDDVVERWRPYETEGGMEVAIDLHIAVA
jgi:SAM-dependent methyltransferase